MISEQNEKTTVILLENYKKLTKTAVLELALEEYLKNKIWLESFGGFKPFNMFSWLYFGVGYMKIALK